MKKLIFGCALMISGMIGSSAWLIAHVLLVEPGAWSSVTNIFPLIGFGGIDGIPFKLKSAFDFSFIHKYGKVFKVYDDQDSGNICFGTEKDGQRYVAIDFFRKLFLLLIRVHIAYIAAPGIPCPG